MARRKVRSKTRIITRMAVLMLRDFQDGVTPSPFAYEALFIAELRSSLCLASWPWPIADQAARDLVSEALRQIRAERPSWHEGQREWTIAAGLLIERTRCVRCHRKLPEGHHKFCSALCGNAHQLRLHRLLEANNARITG